MQKTMGFTALHMFCLLSAFTPTMQELVSHTVSPTITAECGKQVILNCNVSSSQPGLSIKHMKWSQNKTTLCSVDSQGTVTTHRRASLSDFHCEYEHGRLSLILQKVQPLESGHSKPYMCKQHSNQAASHRYTTVELQECCGTVEGVLTSNGPMCIFNHVYPDGDVHWFHGSHNLSDGTLRHNTTKSVDEHGWLTIRGYLERKSSHAPYNCSLKSTLSGGYIAGVLVEKRDVLVRGRVVAPIPANSNGLRSQETMRTFLCIWILLAVTLK